MNMRIPVCDSAQIILSGAGPFLMSISRWSPPMKLSASQCIFCFSYLQRPSVRLRLYVSTPVMLWLLLTIHRTLNWASSVILLYGISDYGFTSPLPAHSA